MRNDQLIHLWILWALWGNLLIAYLVSQLSGLTWGILTGVWTTLCIAVAAYHQPWTIRLTMFKTKRKQESTETLSSLTTDPLASATPLTVTAASSVKRTLIAQGATLTGEICNQSDVLIEGTVVGDIKSARSIHIGQEGKVEGTLIADNIIINGELSGQCQAQTVKILSQGRVDGDIHAGELSIEPGGVFNGHSQCCGDKALSPAITHPSTSPITLEITQKNPQPVEGTSTDSVNQ